MKVNEKKRGRPLKSNSTLDKNIIINAAKDLMEQHGKIPSIRKLSATLGVDAMAIYYYFNNKQALLEEITTSLIDDIYSPVNTELWQQELLMLCKSYLAILERYDGLLNTLLTMESDSPAKIFIERFNLIIDPLDISITTQRHFLDLLVDYIHGFALAKSCDEQNRLTIDDVDGPIGLICKAIN